MKALGDILIKMGLSKKERWVQNSASFYLTMQRGKGLPKREDTKHGMSNLAFGSDTGDPSKLGQSAHPAERLLPSAKEKLFLSLNHTWIHAVLCSCMAKMHRAKNEFQGKITCKGNSSA